MRRRATVWQSVRARRLAEFARTAELQRRSAGFLGRLRATISHLDRPALTPPPRPPPPGRRPPKNAIARGLVIGARTPRPEIIGGQKIFGSEILRISRVPWSSSPMLVALRGQITARVWNSANGSLVSFASGNGAPALAAAREGTMTWTNSDVRREPALVGRTLYWLATIVAALMVVFAIADFFIAWAQGAPILRVFALVAAALVWLIGRALRALLT